MSRTKGREGDSFVSPREQRERIEQACDRDGLTLTAVHEELDVSGGTALADRSGLRAAVEAVEAGEVGVIVAAYFDRLVRSLDVQSELIRRVEAAGGRVLAVDVGEVGAGSAGQWLNGTMLGAISEYVRRAAKERSAEAQVDAVARGVVPWPNIPPGYVRGADGVLVVDEKVAPAVREAFALRAGGGTWQEVRELLRSAGVDRTYHGVQAMLRSRLYLGEIRFGKLVNLAAHPALIDMVTWRQVQAVQSPRGPRPESDRLLARLGVLRCGTCDARMVVGIQTQNGRRYPFYRCPPNGDCEKRVTVSAEMVEGLVVDAVIAALSGVEGRAAVEDGARDAEVALEAAQGVLDAAIASLGGAGLLEEPASVVRLRELRDERDRAEEEVARRHLGRPGEVVAVTAADWGVLSPGERRALVRAVVRRVTVRPGRGASRVTVELAG